MPEKEDARHAKLSAYLYHSVVAVQVQQGTFTVTVTPSEGGKVTAGPGVGAGLACGSGDTRCHESYLDDVGVLLHAAPATEWRTSHGIINDRTLMTDAPLLLKGGGPYAAQAIFTPKALSISSTPPPMRGAFYEYGIKTSGGRGEPTFSLLQGPPGMTIDGEGIGADEEPTTGGMLEWEATPEQIGTHEVIVQANDVDGLTAQQTFMLTVGEETFDTVEPVITLAAAPEVMLLGQSVTITSAATDNIGVLDFALILNDQKVATSLGSFTYTPPTVGRYRVVAVAQDGGGNTDLKRVSFWVKDATATIKLYEGFDAEHGVSHADPTVMTFTSAPLTEKTSIPLPPGVTRLATFGPAADLHFEAANGLRLFLEPGVTGALLPNTAYASVTAATLPALALTAWPEAGQPVTKTDTVVFKTMTGAIFKLGNFTVNSDAWTVTVSYEAIQ